MTSVVGPVPGREVSVSDRLEGPSRLATRSRSALLVAALLLPGCASGGFRPLRALDGDATTRITEEELSERLDRFAEFYAQSIAESVQGFAAGDTDPALRRAVLVWQIQSIKTCRNSVLATDPQVAFTDVWALCVQQREYVTSEPFTKRFGTRAAPLVTACRACESEIAVIGASFLKPAELEHARADVEAFAKANPIRDGFARAAPLPSTAGTTAAQQLSWVTAVPMAPFRFVTGIDEGAAAIRHFSGVAERFARRIDTLPQETLWEMQLLLYDVEQMSAVQRTVGSLESAARTGESFSVTAREFQATADRLAATAANMPADMRKEADALLADIDARQGELRKTIEEVRGALADARAVAEKADAAVLDAKSAGAGFEGTAKSVGEAARALEAAVQAYQAMMREIHPPGAPEKPHDPDKRPFDVLDWQRTADSIAKAASELRGVLGEFRTVATDKGAAEAAAAVAANARAEAQATIDHAFVRALELVAAIAVLVVVVRFVRPRRAAP